MTKIKNIISAIDQAFIGMSQRKEKSAIVRLFEFDEPKSLVFPSQVYQAHFAKISLVRDRRKRCVRILYRSADEKNPEGRFKMFPWNTAMHEKSQFLRLLKLYRILPSEDEFLQARSLLNSMSCTTVESIIHGDVVAAN